MSSRTIAIRITIDNKDAINNAKAQAVALRSASVEADRLTQLQAGLTNSFLKGNLAARAISIGYELIKKSLLTLAETSIDFQFTMAKIAAISGESKDSVDALENSIRGLALTSSKSAVDLAKASLEMNKIGLNNNQVRLLINSVLDLSVALDEDLVTSGETVVNILNAYGDSVLMGKTRTEELATTVAVSALNMESFRVAFAYVGATAKLAGVTFEDLTAAMDMLSNAGIKASTIGTQLRRIFVTLSDENSDASKAIGGTIQSLGGLIPAMEALKKATPSGDKGVAFLSGLFGKTAVSVAALMEQNTEALKGFSAETLNNQDNLHKMNELMQETMKFKIGELSNAWKDFGIELGKVADGPMKFIVDATSFLLRDLGDQLKQVKNDLLTTNSLDRMNATAASLASGNRGMGDLRVIDEQNLQKELIETDKLLKKNEDTKTEDNIKNKEDILEQIKLKFSLFEVGKGSFNFGSAEKDLNGLADGLIKLGDDASVKSALKILAELRTIENAQKKDTEFNPMGVFDKLDEPANERGDTYQDLFQKRLKKTDQKDLKDAIKDQHALETYIDKLEEFKKKVQESKFEVQAFAKGIGDLAGGLDSISFTFGEQMVESFSRGKSAFKDFDDMFGMLAKKMIADLIALTAKFLIFQAIVGLIPGAGLGGFAFRGSAVAGGDSGLLGTLLSSFGGKAFASGTDQVVTRPTAFIAGESGMERVSVTPRSKMGSGGQGASIVVNIQGDVYGGEKFQEAVQMAQSKLRKKMV